MARKPGRPPGQVSRVTHLRPAPGSGGSWGTRGTSSPSRSPTWSSRIR